MKSLFEYIHECIYEAREIPEIMYRNNEAFGAGVTDAVKVCQYEIFELKNIDILDTAVTYLTGSFRTEVSDVMTVVEEEDEDAEIFDDEDLQKTFIKKLLEELRKVFGMTIKYALWLASKKSVEDNYSGGHISAYPTSKVILSDLNGHNPNGDGILFRYEKMPSEI